MGQWPPICRLASQEFYWGNKMKNKIIDLEEKLRLAMISSDVEMLDKLISDELIFIGPDGSVATKQMDLELHRSGLQKITKLSPSEQKILTFDNCAAVSVKMQIEGTYAGSNISGSYQYIRTWFHHNDCWQIISGAVVKIIT